MAQSLLDLLKLCTASDVMLENVTEPLGVMKEESGESTSKKQGTSSGQRSWSRDGERKDRVPQRRRKRSGCVERRKI